MSDEKQECPDDLTEVEQVLMQFSPRPSTLSPAQTIFLAGRESAARQRSSNWGWPASTVALACTVAVLAVIIVRNSTPQIVYLPSPQTPDATDNPLVSTRGAEGAAYEQVESMDTLAASGANYLRHRRLVLAQGVDVLSTKTTGRARALHHSTHDLMEELLREPFGSMP